MLTTKNTSMLCKYDVLIKGNPLVSDQQILLTKNKNVDATTGISLGLRPANERRRYIVTTSLIGWAQT